MENRKKEGEDMWKNEGQRKREREWEWERWRNIVISISLFYFSTEETCYMYLYSMSQTGIGWRPDAVQIWIEVMASANDLRAPSKIESCIDWVRLIIWCKRRPVGAKNQVFQNERRSKARHVQTSVRFTPEKVSKELEVSNEIWNIQNNNEALVIRSGTRFINRPTSKRRKERKGRRS